MGTADLVTIFSQVLSGPTSTIMAVLRVKAYAVLGAVAGIGAYAFGLSLGYCLAVAAAAPVVLVLAPRFVSGALRGATTPSAREHPTELMSGTEF